MCTYIVLGLLPRYVCQCMYVILDTRCGGRVSMPQKIYPTIPSSQGWASGVLLLPICVVGFLW